MRNIVTYNECINFVNLSLITEVSSESTYQIWIQTLNMLVILKISKKKLSTEEASQF